MIHKSKWSLENYFTDSSIISEVVKYAVKRAVKYKIYRSSFGWAQMKEEPTLHLVRSIIPPRRRWMRPNKSERNKLNEYAIMYRSIFDRIMHDYRKGTIAYSEWGARLISFLRSVQNLLVDPWSYERKEFVFKLIPKQSSTKQRRYRLISIHCSMKNRVFFGILSRYLRERCESLSHHNAYSKSNNHSYKSAVATFHKFRLQHIGTPLFVREFDIQRLYDSVRHRDVLSSISKLSLALGGNLDLRIVYYVEYLLRIYHRDLKKSLLGNRIYLTNKKAADDEEFGEAAKSICAQYRNLPHDKIGLPTGSPLSVQLASLVLSDIDDLFTEEDKKECCYVRYVDNIWIAHINKDNLVKVNQTVLNYLNKLKLYPHKEVQLHTPYYTFIASKSKPIFCWDSPKNITKAVPWVKILGHSIRYDGHIKISEENICRIIKQQNKISKKYLYHTSKILSKGILPLRTTARLPTLEDILPHIAINMRRLYGVLAIGRCKLEGYKIDRQLYKHAQQFSLISAFSLVTTSHGILDNLRRLDGNMERNIEYIFNIIKTRYCPDSSVGMPSTGSLLFSYHQSFLNYRKKINYYAAAKKYQYFKVSIYDFIEKKSTRSKDAPSNQIVNNDNDKHDDSQDCGDDLADYDDGYDWRYAYPSSWTDIYYEVYA